MFNLISNNIEETWMGGRKGWGKTGVEGREGGREWRWGCDMDGNEDGDGKVDEEEEGEPDRSCNEVKKELYTSFEMIYSCIYPKS